MRIRFVCMSLLLASAGIVLAATPPPALPPDKLTVETLGPPKPHWAYVLDASFENEIDSRVYVFDGDSYRRLGQIDAGFVASVAISPDRRTTAVATTYFSRGGHGKRTDVIELTDNHTLAITREIVLPPKRSQTVAMFHNVNFSPDGRFLYAAYVTPGASFGVVDVANGRVLGEIDTGGCFLVIPFAAGVSSLCGNGRLLSVTMNAQGRETSRAMSEPFFDPERDPVFSQGVPISDGMAFISFLGEVHEVSLTGRAPTFRPVWSLVTGADRGQWRPGGQQIGAYHRGQKRLYVPMHRGGEGTHKTSGTEIWVFDMTTHQRIARWQVDQKQMAPVLALQVSQDSAPVLFAATDDAQLAVLDAQTGRIKHVEAEFGQTPWAILNP